MKITVKELKELMEIEQFLFELGIGKQKATEENIAPFFHKFYAINEKLEQRRLEKNKKERKRKNKKRKINKNYCRSKKEKERK